MHADRCRREHAGAGAADARTSRLAPHREWSLAWQAGATAGVSAFAAALFALWAGWPLLALAALGVCIFVMVLGSLPLPQLVAPKLLAGVVAGVLVAIFYRLVVQPAIGSTAGLLLTLAPFLLLGGFARAHPRTGIAGIDANMCFMLASQAGMPATRDSALILAESAALAVAAGLMAGGFMLLPRRAQRQALDAATVIRRDLQRIVESGTGGNAAEWHARGARQILRLTLHLGRAAELGERWPKGLLATLNLGQALMSAMLRERMPPRQTARALHALAEATADETLRRAIARLAATLDLAADLLAYGPARGTAPAA